MCNTLEAVNLVSRKYGCGCEMEPRAVTYLLTYLLTYSMERSPSTREWRKLHNEELNDVYSSPNIVRVNGVL
jgi:hypothetical protein